MVSKFSMVLKSPYKQEQQKNDSSSGERENRWDSILKMFLPRDVQRTFTKVHIYSLLGIVCWNAVPCNRYLKRPFMKGWTKFSPIPFETGTLSSSWTSFYGDYPLPPKLKLGFSNSLGWEGGSFFVGVGKETGRSDSSIHVLGWSLAPMVFVVLPNYSVPHCMHGTCIRWTCLAIVDDSTLAVAPR